VFQQFNLLSRTSALENVELPTVYAGIGPEERTKRAMESLTRVGLADRAGHHPSQLSEGTATARGDCPGLVEPARDPGSLTSLPNLDKAGHRSRSCKSSKNLNDEQGLTIVLVTHEHDIAQFAKRTLEFRRRKAQAGYRRVRPFDCPRRAGHPAYRGAAGCRDAAG